MCIRDRFQTVRDWLAADWPFARVIETGSIMKVLFQSVNLSLRRTVPEFSSFHNDSPLLK